MLHLFAALAERSDVSSRSALKSRSHLSQDNRKENRQINQFGAGGRQGAATKAVIHMSPERLTGYGSREALGKDCRYPTSTLRPGV